MVPPKTKMVPQKEVTVEMISDSMSKMKTKLNLKDGLEFAQRLLNKIGFQNSPSQPNTPGIFYFVKGVIPEIRKKRHNIFYTQFFFR